MILVPTVLLLKINLIFTRTENIFLYFRVDQSHDDLITVKCERYRVF